MHFPPSRLKARVALEDERREVHHQQLQRRQRGGGNNDDNVDPFESFLSEIFGPDTTTSTKTRTRTTATPTTATRPTVITPPVVSTPTTRTSTTPSTTSTTPQTSAQVVTTPPPNVTRTSTSTLSTTSTGNVDANQANNSSSKSGLPSVVVGVIVAASIIFGLIFLALIARKIFQSRRRNRRATWARNSIIAPFEPTLQEKALPPPPMENPQVAQQNYPAYPPAAMGYTNNITPYSPITAAPNTGYSAPYPFAPKAMGGNPQQSLGPPANGFGANTFAAPDLTGPAVIIQTTPPTPSTAATNSTSPIAVVKRTFMPSLPDELSISNGEQVRVLAVYDDGWAQCEKLQGGERGAVPQECLDMTPQANSNTPQQQLVPNGDTHLNRNSSLRRNQDQTY